MGMMHVRREGHTYVCGADAVAGQTQFAAASCGRRVRAAQCSDWLIADPAVRPSVTSHCEASFLTEHGCYELRAACEVCCVCVCHCHWLRMAGLATLSMCLLEICLSPSKADSVCAAVNGGLQQRTRKMLILSTTMLSLSPVHRNNRSFRFRSDLLLASLAHVRAIIIMSCAGRLASSVGGSRNVPALSPV